MTLKSLAESRVPADLPWEVIVVDNNSTDPTQLVVESFIYAGHPNFRYLFEPQQGKSFALNAGIAQAKGKLIATTDDDCIVDSQWLTSIWREFDSDPDLAAVGGRVELYNRLDTPMTVRLSKQRMGVFSISFEACSPPIIGCNMAFKREAFNSIGDFDQKLGPGSKHALVSEDMDWIYRACKRAFKVVYSPDLVVYHNHGRRTDSDWEITCRNYARGRGGFYCKHILTGDREILRLAYWEINDLWKKMWREVLVGNFAQKDLSALWNLLLGTIYRLREEIRR